MPIPTGEEQLRASRFCMFALLVAATSTGILEGCGDEGNHKAQTRETSLSGQVFAETPEGEVVTARGRIVTVVRSNREMMRQAEEACKQTRALAAQAPEISATRASIEKLRQFDEVVQISGSPRIMGSAYAGDEVAATTADMQGRFTFPTISPGAYFVFAKTDHGDGRIYWLEHTTVRSGVANQVMLGTDATDWRQMCRAIVAARSDGTAER
jgi:hypothetical protein